MPRQSFHEWWFIDLFIFLIHSIVKVLSSFRSFIYWNIQYVARWLTDINECDNQICGSLTCVNTPGSYSCTRRAAAAAAQGAAPAVATTGTSMGVGTIVIIAVCAAVAAVLINMASMLGVKRLIRWRKSRSMATADDNISQASVETSRSSVRSGASFDSRMLKKGVLRHDQPDVPTETQPM